MTFKLSINSQIRLVLFGEFLVITCISMTDPYWPLILKLYLPEHSHSSLVLWSTVIYLAPFVASVLAIPFWGYMGSFLGYKKMIIRCTVALAIVQTLLIFTDHIVEIFVLRLVQGAFTGYTAVAQAFLVSKKPDGEHSFLIGKVQSMMATGTILGPVFGGFISHYFNYYLIFTIASVTLFLLTVACVFFLSESPLINKGKDKAKLKFSVFLKLLTPFNSYCYLLVVSTKILRRMSASFFALYVIDQLSGNNLQTGTLYAAMAAMVFLVAPIWGKVEDRHNKNVRYLICGLVIALFSAAAAQVIYGFAQNFASAVCASVLWGCALGVTNTLPLSLLTHHQKASMKGFALSVGSSMNRLGNVFGIALGGFLYCYFGFQATFFSIGIGYLLIAFIFWCCRGVVLNNKD
ncbi:MFS transporter [Endozoicomonas gorgoniicola]|uniref:MFS transporter n=1 Tax=Endozoicomonas gorgoniicola TaxID=1234144 RepID=A0ABT3MRE4_9GAMM|nr:MFS transporter [Endozoicomonas gorgoniicola]MCW7551936.1 MFS transporter [Endozoicomonas gorgoniicola]